MFVVEGEKEGDWGWSDWRQARGRGRGLCGSIAGKLGKGDGKTGEDSEDESLKNQKICGEFVVAEGEEEGDRGWSDWRGGGGDGDDDGCVGLSQGKGDGETREEEDERTKIYLYF